MSKVKPIEHKDYPLILFANRFIGFSLLNNDRKKCSADQSPIRMKMELHPLDESACCIFCG